MLMPLGLSIPAILITAIISSDARGCPAASRAMPGLVFRSWNTARDIALLSSEVPPLRSTSTCRGLPVA